MLPLFYLNFNSLKYAILQAFIAKMWISYRFFFEFRKKTATYPQELHFYTLPRDFLSFIFPYFPIKEKKKLRYSYFINFLRIICIFLLDFKVNSHLSVFYICRSGFLSHIWLVPIPSSCDKKRVKQGFSLHNQIITSF